MIKYLTILVIFGAVYADPNNQLVAHYPFAGDFNDATGNHSPAINTGTTWTTDKNGKANSAISFSANTQTVEIPVSTISAFVDYTLCFWMKSDQPAEIAKSLVSWRNNQGSGQYMFLFQRVVGLSTQQIQWNLKQYLLNNEYVSGNWQHICFSRDSFNKKYHIYVNGLLLESIDVSTIEDSHPLDVSSFILGNHQFAGQYREVYQYYGSLQDFRVYARSFTAADAAEVRDDIADPIVDDQICISYLDNLLPGVITEQISLPFDTSNDLFYHQYDISFNTFNFDANCFESQIWLGGNLIHHTVIDNKIIVKFPWKDAVSQGCTQFTPTQQQCQFQLQIYFKGQLQHVQMFTSIIDTPNLNDLSAQLSLHIINDEDFISQLQFDQTIYAIMELCSDPTCSQYIAPYQIVRNTDIYVEFKVNTPGYNQFYPIHKSLTIDGLDVAIQNQATVDNWQEQGRIIYHIRPPFASPSAVLAIGVSLSKTNPHGGRRMLQEQEDKTSQYLTGVGLLDDQRDNVGKYIRVQIVDHDGKLVEHKQNQEESSDEKVTIAIIGAVAAVVLIVSLAGIGLFYKLRKSKSDNNSSSKQQGQQLEPNSPESLKTEENKLNIQVE